MTINVKDFGAAGDNATDDRAAIQAAIDAAETTRDEVFIPEGTYIVGENSGNAYCLRISSSVRLRGVGRASSVLKQKANIVGGSVRLLYVNADNVAIRDLGLDGNKANQMTMDEHRAGIFADTCAHLSVVNVVSQNFTGDGFTLYNGNTEALFLDCYAAANDRDGIAFTPSTVACDGVTLISCEFVGNAGQQIDSEPGVVVNNVSIIGCLADAAGVNNDYVITTAGPSNTVRNQGWSIANCTINGPLEVIWIDGLSIIGCNGVNPTTKPMIDFQRRSIGVKVIGNTFRATQTSVASVPVVSIVGTGVGDSPEAVIIANNALDYTAGPSKSFGIVATGCISVMIVDNYIEGPGLSQADYSGVYIRATVISQDCRSCIVRGNTIRNWGQTGVIVDGNNAAKLLYIDVSHNIFDDTAGFMVDGINLDDSTHAVQQATVIGNQCMGNVTTPISAFPNCPVLIGGTSGAGGVYSATTAQLATLVEAVGAIAYARDGGTSTTLYVKESGGGTSSGWVAK